MRRKKKFGIIDMKELVNERTKVKKSYLTSNGMTAHEIYSFPIFYVDENGDYQPINCDIFYNTDVKNNYKHYTLYNDFKVQFKHNLKLDKAVHFQKSGGVEGDLYTTINGLYLYDTTTKKKVLIETAKDNVSEVNGNIITYKNVFTGVDFQYTSNMHGLKEDVILNKEIKTLIPDPISVGMNIETTYLAISVSFHSAHGVVNDDNVVKIIGEDGNGYAWIDDIVSKSVYDKYDIKSFYEFNDDADEYIFGISYNATQVSQYPITIDPTIMSVATVNWQYYIDGGSWSSGGATMELGYFYSFDGKDYWYDNFENYFQFDISSLRNYTISSGSGVNISLSNGGSGFFDTNLHLQEVANYTGQPTRTWKYDYGALLKPFRELSGTTGFSVNSYYTFTPDIKRSILTNKLNNKVSFGVVYSGIMTSDTSQVYINVNNNNGISMQPKLTINGYNTFTQNTPTVDGSNATVSWTNGGGLVSGDKHRIYYAQGTGLTASQIVANNKFVETTSYNATTAVITGLVAGNSYSVVIVDCQKVDTIFYEGAISSVQTFTIASATPTPALVTIVSVTSNKIGKASGKDRTTVKFKFDKDVTQWEVRVTGTGQGTGILADSGGSVLANAEINAVIDWTECYQEGGNRVNIYGYNGVWTPYEA